jgi:hypothetical protein
MRALNFGNHLPASKSPEAIVFGSSIIVSLPGKSVFKISPFRELSFLSSLHPTLRLSVFTSCASRLN